MTNADWWKVTGLVVGGVAVGILVSEFLGSRGHLTWIWPAGAANTTTTAPGLSESGD